MNEILKLSPRLLCAAGLCREGAFVADVGTDHAYLPIYLCLEGKARGGVASDINKGPVERARKNVEKYGLEERLFVKRTDGLDGIEAYSPDHIMILGMGGELIAKIIADAPWTKSESIRLCLQPMTHPEHLRRFLLENGYEIVNEALVEEEKIYQIILAEYTGKTDFYTEAELLLGRINIARHSDALVRSAEHWAKILNKRIEGKLTSGADASAEIKLINEIKTITGGNAR